MMDPTKVKEIKKKIKEEYKRKMREMFCNSPGGGGARVGLMDEFRSRMGYSRGESTQENNEDE